MQLYRLPAHTQRRYDDVNLDAVRTYNERVVRAVEHGNRLAAARAATAAAHCLLPRRDRRPERVARLLRRARSWLPVRRRAGWQHEHAQQEMALVCSKPILYNTLQLQGWTYGGIQRDRDIAIARRREQCAELIQRTALPWLYHPDGAMLARFIEQDGAVLEG